jgi:hypothetical protein
VWLLVVLLGLVVVLLSLLLLLVVLVLVLVLVVLVLVLVLVMVLALVLVLEVAEADLCRGWGGSLLRGRWSSQWCSCMGVQGFWWSVVVGAAAASALG